MADDLRDAIALLRRKRAAAAVVVEKYDKALAALLAIEDGVTPDDADEGTAASLVTDNAPVPRPSVLTMAKRLLDEDDRLWTVAGIIEEYEKRGTPVEAADPANALRTALSTLVKRDQAHRESPGYFRSAKYPATTAYGVEAGGDPEGLRLTGS